MESLVLPPQDVGNLEAVSDDFTRYFYKVLDYLGKRVEDGMRRGCFFKEAAKVDLETALWYSYACNNLDECESYCRAAQWVATPEGSAEAARYGMWYHHYSCALLYCGRLKKALAYVEKGMAVEPDYVRGWLQLGKLCSHFSDTARTLAAVEQGLAPESGDYEFIILVREIQEGRNLGEMEYHWVDPKQGQWFRVGEVEEGGMADRCLAIACILCDQTNLEAVRAVLGVTEWGADAPYYTFTTPYGEGTVQDHFLDSGVVLSKLSAEWAAALAARLPELNQRGRTSLKLRTRLQTDGLELAWFTTQWDQGLRLCFQRGGRSQMVLLGAGFSLREKKQPALEQLGSVGNFPAFMLLEEPEWDPEAFKQALRDYWGIPYMTELEDGEDGENTPVFKVEGMLAALSFYLFPVPHGEAEEAAGRCYLWSEAKAAARRYKGWLLVLVLGRRTEPQRAAALQMKLVRATCGQAGTLGVHANGTIYPPKLYQEAAASLDGGELFLLNLAWVGLYRMEEGMGAYIDSLHSFGKDELEVPNARAEPAEVRNLLLNVVGYSLEEDVTLQDGKTIGLSEKQRLSVARNVGVGQEGMILKIGWSGEV